MQATANQVYMPIRPLGQKATHPTLEEPKLELPRFILLQTTKCQMEMK